MNTEDDVLIEQLSAEVLGRPVYPVSAHRAGSRPVPHCWWWRQGDSKTLTLYDGTQNREWNPLASQADAAEVGEAMAMRGTPLPQFDLETEDGRRALCRAAIEAMTTENRAAKSQPQQPIRAGQAFAQRAKEKNA